MIDLYQFVPGILLIVGLFVAFVTLGRLYYWIKGTNKVGFGYTNLTNLYGLYEKSERISLEGGMLYLGPIGIGIVRTKKKKES